MQGIHLYLKEYEILFMTFLFFLFKVYTLEFEQITKYGRIKRL